VRVRFGRPVVIGAAVVLAVSLTGLGLVAAGAGGLWTASNATASPTASPSPTPSPSPTASPSPTPSPSPTASPSPKPIIYTFPLYYCKFSYSHYHHDYPATDIYVAVGCPFVAVTSGVVDEVGLVDYWPTTKTAATRGGKFVSIVGDDGVRYYGSHLSEVEEGIRPGVRVEAGALLGKTGRTGNARSMTPHLHFGISWPTGPNVWWVRRGEVYPWPYLDAWRTGIAKSPAAAVAARHKLVGDGPCTNYC
jgi:murein DD-endopeptidase MepM/ murein hydrolase activator NlpD